MGGPRRSWSFAPCKLAVSVITTYGQVMSQTRQPRRPPGCARSSRRRGRWSAMRSTSRPATTPAGTSIRAPSLLHAIARRDARGDRRRALFIVPPGTGLWMPAQTRHVTRMPAGLRMRALFLREDAARAGPDAVTVVAVSPLLRALILAACEEPVMWDEARAGAACGGAGAARDRPRRDAARSRCRPAAIRGCSASPMRCWPTPPTRAAWRRSPTVAGASARTLARLFRRDTGMSFQAWRRQLRLTEALASLAQGETPARAAAAVGYSSGPAFGAAFRAAFGTTPGRLRQEHDGEMRLHNGHGRQFSPLPRRPASS